MIECIHCDGDGMDPYTDYLLPCPQCDGAGVTLACDEPEDDSEAEGRV